MLITVPTTANANLKGLLTTNLDATKRWKPQEKKLYSVNLQNWDSTLSFFVSVWSQASTTTSLEIYPWQSIWMDVKDLKDVSLIAVSSHALVKVLVS